jgi:hypothetical protein
LVWGWGDEAGVRRGPQRGLAPARHADSGVDEAYFDAFAMFTSLDQLLDFAGQVIARTGRL